MRAVIPCIEIISLWWKCGNVRCICKQNQTSGNIIRLWRTSDIRAIQKHTSQQIILGTFPIEDLRVAVDAAKRMLIEEKLDRQLSGQSCTTTAFMKVDVHSHLIHKIQLENN